MDSCYTLSPRIEFFFKCVILFLAVTFFKLHDFSVAQTTNEVNLKFSSASAATPPISSGSFGLIEISPSVFPHYSQPNESLPPMYPSFPRTYEPKLTGRCPVNFSVLANVIEKTASDCSQYMATVVGSVICCPQLGSLLHIFQGYFNLNSENLALKSAIADDCFSDLISILASRGANNSIPTLCSVKSLNFTGGSCPVKDHATFEKLVNTTKLLEACSTIDPLKECCRPVCQPAIMEASVVISEAQVANVGNSDADDQSAFSDPLADCKGIAYSYLSKKLSPDAANTAFRILSSCKVNKACPLNFSQPASVIKECQNVDSLNSSCCSSLSSYISGVQKQMLITNKQAIMCSTSLGSVLRRGGVLSDVYKLCDIDLKDFSIQGCLLRSLPADVLFDNATGFSFTCDLTDNIAAPWPSSSSMSSYSLCAPEMSLPALPTSETMKSPGYHGSRCGIEFLLQMLSLFIMVALIY